MNRADLDSASAPRLHLAEPPFLPPVMQRFDMHITKQAYLDEN
jgi:hypothetical protein